MAKKPTTPVSRSTTTPAKTPAAKAASPAPVTSPVRNTAVPKTTSAAKPVLTHEMIAKRAYEIYLSGTGGSEHDNWVRAERELRGA